MKINYENKIISFEGETNLLDLLRTQGIEIDASCNGNGTCGKCKVYVDGKVRKACQVVAKDGMQLAPFNKKAQAEIMTEVSERELEIKPVVEKQTISLEQASLENQKAWSDRLSKATGKSCNDPNLLNKLYELVKNNVHKINVFSVGNVIVDITEDEKSLGIAIDIGTTTLAAYLYDLTTGNRIKVASSMNPQKAYGADVISRIDFASKGLKERETVKNSIIKEINHLISDFSLENVHALAITGNTTMIHLLMGLDSSGIAIAPFVPLATQQFILKAKELGINCPWAGVIILPSVAAYVGADTVSAVLSSGIYEAEKPTLLVDIGTNGEMALRFDDRIISCSTAAGPAFEGANISSGMPGVHGAICQVSLVDGDIKFETIGDLAPKGICGSGLLDLMALLIKNDIVDATGRIVDQNEVEASWAKVRIIEADNGNSFLLTEDIVLTQKDVREVQNAKAAICAGIKVMAQKAGISLNSIEMTYLAGGFGNYMNKASAIKIGLLPDELKGHIESIGNAAGLGASIALLNKDLLKKGEELAETIEYIELSSDPEFVNHYVECMMFGDDL